jgi:hypothetical protein
MGRSQSRGQTRRPGPPLFLLRPIFPKLRRTSRAASAVAGPRANLWAVLLDHFMVKNHPPQRHLSPFTFHFSLIVILSLAHKPFTLPAMVELSTYLFPAIQAFFCIIIGVVWLIGFFRQHNLGFILLGFVVLAEAVTALVRQALINYVIYHQPHLSVTERTTFFGTISMVFLGIYVFYWIAGGLGAVLIVFRRTESESQAIQRPPVS